MAIKQQELITFLDPAPTSKKKIIKPIVVVREKPKPSIISKMFKTINEAINNLECLNIEIVASVLNIDRTGLNRKLNDFKKGKEVSLTDYSRLKALTASLIRLKNIFVSYEQIDLWLIEPREIFASRKPIELMLDGAGGLYKVDEILASIN